MIAPSFYFPTVEESVSIRNKKQVSVNNAGHIFDASFL